MISEKIVRFRAGRLPEGLGTRLGEEWLAELNAIDSPPARLRFAMAILFMPTRALEQEAGRRDLPGIPVAPASRDRRVYADYWSRVPALMIDGFVTDLTFRILRWSLHLNPADSQLAEYGLGWLVLAHVVCVARCGGSPGKLVMGLRIVAADGTVLTWRQAWVREAPYLAMYAIGNLMSGVFAPESGVRWMVGLAMGTFVATDIVVYIWNSQHRALHDLMAGTAVIHRKTRVVVTRTNWP